MIVTMNQAGNGDCILIESEGSKILVDGGTAASFNDWKSVVSKITNLDCLFITHIDNDHVNGVLKLIESEDRIGIDNVIFNGAKQILELDYDNRSDDDYVYEALAIDFSPDSDEEVEIGYSEATSLSYLLEEKNYQINEINKGKAIHTDSYSGSIKMGVFEIEFVGPTRKALAKLRRAWFDILSERGLKRKVVTKIHSKAFEQYVNGLALEHENDVNISNDQSSSIKKLSEIKYQADKSLANETSLSFIVRSNGKSILMLGDAHMETVIEWLDKHEIPILNVDAVKVAHHGSNRNISKELIERLNCKKYFISTNGKRFFHPDVDVIAKIARYTKTSETTIYMNNKVPHISDDFIERLTNFNDTVEIKFGTDGVVL